MYLLEQIRQGNNQAWGQFVERYHGRLFAYAHRQVGHAADAEDVLQDTFVSFIRSLQSFEGRSSVESYLFTILRRNIIEVYRRKHRGANRLIQDSWGKDFSEESGESLSGFAAEGPTASWYVRRDEHKEAVFNAVAEAILELLGKMKKSLNFEHIKVIELVFYSQLTNTQTAEKLRLEPGRIGVIKLRSIQQIQKHLADVDMGELGEGDLEGLLGQVWQQYRPSCPKRNTIGAFLLETLEPDWRDYVDFHLNVLGCPFCQANFQDLHEQNQAKSSQQLQQRILESTVGFLQKKSS